MTTYLVTGGAGFIGSNLVHQLHAEEGARVVVYDLLTYAGNLDNLASIPAGPRYELVQGDVCDRDLIDATLKRVRPDVILHLAAESHVDRSIDGPREFIRTNVVGTHEMLDGALAFYRGLQGAAKDRFRFLHVSTDEVFGSLGAEGYFTETTPYAPNSPYAASKASADHIARAYFQTYGLPVVTTNCSNNYGPHQFPEKLIPVVVLNALEEKPLPVYGDGKNIRDWLYVGDHCEGLRVAASKGALGETYNLGGRTEKTTLDIVQAICDELNRIAPRKGGESYRALITFVTDRPGHDRRYAIDPAKTERELGWKSRTTFSEGIRQTVQWYLANRKWCERIAQGTYRRERLGLNQAKA